MANLTETSTWENGIYQLETTDPVEGGSGGISNQQAKQLGNRTKWLYDKVQKFLPKNRGYFTGLNVSFSTGPLICSGDIVSATAIALTGDSVVTVTMLNEMPSTNYKVNVSLQSLSTNINDDNDICTPVFKPISTTQFSIAFREMEAIDQNLRVHLEVISLD